MTSKNRRIGSVLTALIVVGTIALSGCGSGGSQKGTMSGRGHSGSDKITVAFRTPNWILPISAPGFTQGENSFFTNTLYRPVFNYNLTTDTKYNIDETKSMGQIPQVSGDNKTYTITLKDAAWSDGTAVTTRDVEFWWNLVNANKKSWASYLEGSFPDNITNFNIIDKKTFSLTTDKAYSPDWFINNQFNKIQALPQHVWDKTSNDGKVGDLDRDAKTAVDVFNYLTGQSKDIATYATNPLWKVVSGPWKIKSYVPNGQVELEPNTAYSGKDKAQVSTLVLRPFTGSDAEFNVLRSEGLDYGYIPATNLSQAPYMEKKGYKVVPWYGYSITYIPLNFAHPTHGPIFAQKYIRQSMQKLIDQPTVSKTIWGGMAAPTCGPVPMASDKMGSTEGCAYSFDPKGAGKLLTDNGWKVVPDGTTTCEKPGTGAGQCGKDIPAGAKLNFKLISQSGFDSTSKMVAEFKSQMSKVGIVLDIQEVPDSVSVSQKCVTGKECTWDMSFFGSQGSWYYPVYASGERLFQTDAPVNLGLYSSKEADELINATQFSSDSSALKKYNDFLAEDLPVLWVPNPVYQISAFKSSLQGIEPLDLMNQMYPENWSWAK